MCHKNDLMTPYQLESSCVSRITLAYFEDIKGQNIQPYCDIPFEQKCDSYENGIGTCALCKHENQLNESNQYADDSFAFTDIEKEKYGGYPFLDYCPVLLIHHHTQFWIIGVLIQHVLLPKHLNTLADQNYTLLKKHQCVINDFSFRNLLNNSPDQ
ncbi:unnamed protein product [Schistosoma rodhaini]|nr:unnamed protein product [Schistosoma rodhaini]